MKHSFGGWRTIIPYLEPAEQVSLQGLDRWTYETGVPRAAETSLKVGEKYYFPSDEGMLELSRPGNQVTIIKQFEKRYYPLFKTVTATGWDFFELDDRTKKCKVLRKSAGSAQFRVIEKAPMLQARVYSDYCNMDNQFIFATGGQNDNEALKSVERYIIARDVWEEMPEMNVARYSHGSCAQGTAVFVVCGTSTDNVDEVINSIEKLEAQDLQAGWQLIQMPPQSLLTPRLFPLLVPLNSNEILVMGGMIERNGDYLADILILETRTGSIKEHTKALPFAFACLDREVCHVKSGAFFALVFNDNRESLIEYKDGSISTLFQVEYPEEPME